MVQKIKQRRSIDLHIHIIQTILKYKCKNPKVKIDINMEKYNVSIEFAWPLMQKTRVTVLIMATHRAGSV